MARFTCNTRNFWCWSKKCKEAKKCACNVCSELKAINPNLYDACIDACQEVPRPTDPDKYLCQNIGPEILFNRYGVVMCGFDPYEETLEGNLYKKTEAAKVENQSFETNIMIGRGALLLILIITFVWK